MRKTINKSIILITVFLPVFMLISLFSSSMAMAAGQDCSKLPTADKAKCLENPNNYDSTRTNVVFSGTCRSTFLGLTSWDCGVNVRNQETLKSGIWQIVTNVATDITIIAAYLVLGYVIYGGYLYMFSGGESGKVASGKKTLYHAFIGLAIVMSAYIIMNSIRIALLGSNKAFSDCASHECVSTNDLVTNAVQWVIGIAGAVAAIFVVYGGISYATSAGEPTKLQKAKQTITYALIGLAIVALAEIITAFVSNMIRDANTNDINNNTSQLVTPKENHENLIS